MASLITPAFALVVAALTAWHAPAGRQDAKQPPAKAEPKSWLSGQTLSKGFSLLAAAPGVRLVDVNLDFRPSFSLFGPVQLGSPHEDLQRLDSRLQLLEGELKQYTEKLLVLEQEKLHEQRKQTALMRDQLKVAQRQLEVEIETLKVARERLELDRGVFHFQQKQKAAILRRDEYATVLRPGKLVVVVADFSGGADGEGREIADEIANALAELRKVGGIDVDVLVGEVRPGVLIRSDLMARDVGQHFPRGTCYAVVWGTQSPRTVGKFRPHVTCVFKADEERGVSATYTLDLDPQPLPPTADADAVKREQHERFVAFTCAVIPGCYAAHEVIRERVPDLAQLVRHVGEGSEFAKALANEVAPLAVWPAAREKQNLRYLTRMSAVGPERTFPQLVLNTRDGSLMTLITEPGATRAQVFKAADGADCVVYVDIHETTWRQFLPFLNAAAARQAGGADWLKVEDDPDPARRFTNVEAVKRPTGERVRYKTVDPALDDERPVFNVTYFGAQAYCAHAGKELPTVAEWRAAARPAAAGRFPWGDEFKDPARLCANKQAVVGPFPIHPAGGFASTDRSAIGCLDMAGNVSEWCADHNAQQGTRAVCGGNFGEGAAEDFAVDRAPRWLPQVQHERTVGFRGVVRVKVAP